MKLLPTNGAAMAARKVDMTCCVKFSTTFGVMLTAAAAIFLVTITAGTVIAGERGRCEINLRASQLDIEARLAKIQSLQIELEYAKAQAELQKKRAEEMLLELREWKRGKRRKDGIPVAFEYMYELDPGFLTPTLEKARDKTWKATADEAESQPAKGESPATAGAAIQAKLDAQVRAFKEEQRALRRAKREAEEAAKAAAKVAAAQAGGKARVDGHAAKIDEPSNDGASQDRNGGSKERTADNAENTDAVAKDAALLKAATELGADDEKPAPLAA